MRKRIKNILESVVQGDLFQDNYAKADMKIEMIENELGRLKSEILRLQQEIQDWKSRIYKSNPKKIKDSRGKFISIGDSNERRRKNEIADRNIKIQEYNEKLQILTTMLNRNGKKWNQKKVS